MARFVLSERIVGYAFWAVALALIVFLGISLFSFLELAPGLDEWISPVSLSLTALSGTLGVLTETRDKAGRFTKWGLISIAGVLSSVSVAIADKARESRGAAVAALEVAIDARRATFRQNGIRLRVYFSVSELVPDGYKEALQRRDPVGVLGVVGTTWDWGVSSCHDGFPGLGQYLPDLEAALAEQHLYIAVGGKAWDEKLQAVVDFVGAEKTLAYLEADSFQSGAVASVSVSSSLKAQLADCRSGIRGDKASIVYDTNDNDYLYLEYILPAFGLWSRADEQVLDLTSISTPHVLLVTNTVRDYVGASPASEWFVESIVIELPNGGVLCSENAGFVRQLDQEYVAVLSPLRKADNWRCDP